MMLEVFTKEYRTSCEGYPLYKEVLHINEISAEIRLNWIYKTPLSFFKTCTCIEENLGSINFSMVYFFNTEMCTHFIKNLLEYCWKSLLYFSNNC